jgi:hypothetical protein
MQLQPENSHITMSCDNIIVIVIAGDALLGIKTLQVSKTLSSSANSEITKQHENHLVQNGEHQMHVQSLVVQCG